MQKIVNGKIHNRFDFHVLNVETGEEKTYHAYNIILDGYWETLISSSRALFSQISIGRGSSTLDKGRTTLFDQIASIATTGGVRTYAFPTSSWRQHIVLGTTQYNGETITEVGIRGTRLHTHAMLTDAEGQNISITKNSNMIITIYATFFVTLELGSNETLSAADMRWVYPVGWAMGDTMSAVAQNLLAGPPSKNTSLTIWAAAQNPSFDLPNRRLVLPPVTVGVNDGTGEWTHALLSSGLALKLTDFDDFGGHELVDVPMGMGDGVKSLFLIPAKNMIENTIEVSVDGTLVAPADYTLSPTICLSGPSTRALPSGFGGEYLGYSRNGQFLASYDGGVIRVYSLDENDDLILVPGSTISTGLTLYGLDISDDGNVVVAFTSNGFRAYRRVSGVMTHVSTFGSGLSFGIAVSADGNKVVARVSSSLYGYEWNGTTYVQRGSAVSSSIGSSVKISADGDTIMGPRSADPRFIVADWDTGSSNWVARPSVTEPNGISGEIVAMSPDGLTVLFATTGGSVFIYDWDPVGAEWTRRTSLTSTGVEMSGTRNPVFVDRRNLYFPGNTTRPVAYHWSEDYSEVVKIEAVINASLWASNTSQWLSGQNRSSGYHIGGNIFLSGSYGIAGARLRIGGNLEGVYAVEFNTPPGDQLPVTFSGTVDGVYKTINYTAAIGHVLQFGEPTP